MELHNKKKKTAFFSPFQNIDEFANLELSIANQLQDTEDTFFITCDGIYADLCTAHTAIGIPEKAKSPVLRSSVCQNCKLKRSWLETRFPGRVIKLTPDAALIREVESLLDGITISNFKGFRFEELDIIRMASYEMILNNKINTMDNLSETDFDLLRIHIKNTILTYRLFDRVQKEHSFVRVFMFNGLYSVQSAIRAICEKSGVPAISFHPGLNRQLMMESFYFSPKPLAKYDRDVIDLFELKLQSKSFGQDLHFITQHIQGLFSANSVFTYSSALRGNLTEAKTKLGIDTRWKRVALASFSSNDESFAADYSIFNGDYYKKQFSPFKTQMEWLDFLIQFFGENPEYMLVLRFHPRELPNKRELQTSNAYNDLAKRIANLPPNIMVNRPEDQISIYDLFHVIDLHLFSQTTVGLEGAILGVQGLCHSRGLGNYPQAYINRTVLTIDEYRLALMEELNKEYFDPIAMIKRSINWFNYWHGVGIYNFIPRSKASWTLYRICQRIDRIFIRFFRHFPGLSRSILPRITHLSDQEKKEFLKSIEQGGENIRLKRAVQLPDSGSLPADSVIRTYFLFLIEQTKKHYTGEDINASKLINKWASILKKLPSS